MAKRKTMLEVDFSAFEEYAEKLDELGANLEVIFKEIMEDNAEEVQTLTVEAVQNRYLPAKGNFRRNPSKTIDSINRNPKASVMGSIIEVPLGFDKSKPGAGGWLITGTPKMAPDYELQKIYSRKSYEKELTRRMMQDFQDRIDEIMEG